LQYSLLACCCCCRLALVVDPPAWPHHLLLHLLLWLWQPHSLQLVLRSDLATWLMKLRWPVGLCRCCCCLLHLE
jgi:hypothetical protein